MKLLPDRLLLVYGKKDDVFARPRQRGFAVPYYNHLIAWKPGIAFHRFSWLEDGRDYDCGGHQPSKVHVESLTG